MAPRIVIVGGVAGGMSAATRARRANEQASITVLEKGGFISFANCGLPYYLAGRIEQESSLLVTTPAKVRERFNIDARVHNEVMRIDRAARVVHVRDLPGGTSYTRPYDKLILAPGASAIIPPIENVRASNVFLLRSMEDTRAVRKFLDEKSPKTAAIIGGGFIGLEMAEALRDRKLAVTLIEKNGHVLPPLDREMAQPVKAELEKHGVRVITGDGLKSLAATAAGAVGAVVTESGVRVPADLVLLSIGVRPNTSLAVEAGLAIGPSGAIAVDALQRTNDLDIYAVGDAAEVTHGVTGKPVRVPLAGPANRQGRLVGEHAATGSAPPAGKVLGTAIVQVFELSVALTGLSETAARTAGLNVDVAYASPNHHAGYYPGAQGMRLKIVYDRATGKVLGAQGVGGAGVDKRIDVVATAMHFNGTIDDLAGLDLAYAPQYGSAKDALHIAAMVAQNQRRTLMPAIPPAAVNGQVLIDVRTPEEFTRGSLPGAVNMPVDDLRTRLAELDPAMPTVTFCQVGQRGYVAQRILLQHGFKDVKNLKGGYSLAVQSR